MRAIAEADPPLLAEPIQGLAPMVFRHLVADWPIVRLAKRGGTAWADALAEQSTAAPVRIIRAAPDQGGRFHYGPDGCGVNFDSGMADLSTLIAALKDEAGRAAAYALAAQGLPADSHVAGFAAAHPMPFAHASAEPRLWIGNRSIVATHRDPTDNVAVVAAGRRRFTLLPPDQADNLYLGPAEPSPAGIPVSRVHLTRPDFDRFPRFAEAMATARFAELGPGDAIFIPAGWFHHVEALEPLNLLVNYWWSPAAD